MPPLSSLHPMSIAHLLSDPSPTSPPPPSQPQELTIYNKVALKPATRDREDSRETDGESEIKRQKKEDGMVAVQTAFQVSHCLKEIEDDEIGRRR